VPQAPKDGTEAEVIFHNGAVVTMEDEQPRAQALAIRGKKILAVGGNEEILDLRGPNTQLINLDGKALLPGFVDAHSHIFLNSRHWGLDLEGIQQLVLEYGITALGHPGTRPNLLEQLQALERQGKGRVRTSLYLARISNCGDDLGDWYKQHPPTREPEKMLRVVGVKVFTDGGSCGRSAQSFERPGGGYGDLWLSQSQMNNVVAEAQAAGYQVAIHAIGDRGIEQAQNAIEFALEGQPNTFRHRIEHNFNIRPDLIPRYGEIGIVAVIFGDLPTCLINAGGFAVAKYDPQTSSDGVDRWSWLWPWRDLLDANPGLPIAWHSDAPWFALNPLVNLHGFVTRAEVAGDTDRTKITSLGAGASSEFADGTRCEPRGSLASDAIAVEEALSLMTIGGAYALFQDDIIGSLKPGKFADLVVLSESPLAVEPDSIREIQVLVTMVAGRVEHCAPDQEALCPTTAQMQAAAGAPTRVPQATSTPPEATTVPTRTPQTQPTTIPRRVAPTIQELTCSTGRVTVEYEVVCEAKVTGELDSVEWRIDYGKRWSRKCQIEECGREEALVFRVAYGETGLHEIRFEGCLGGSCVGDVAIVEVVPGGAASGQPCQPNSAPKLTAHLTDLDKIDAILPPFNVSGEQIKPHSYIFIKDGGDARGVPVYAPADSGLVKVAWYLESGKEQYLLTFQISCEVWYRLDHINEVVDRIRSVQPPVPGDYSVGGRQVDPPLAFDAGELIGYSSGALPGCCGTWDFGLYNTSRPNTFAKQERYDRYSGQALYGNCAYEYFEEALREQYYSLLDGGECRTSRDVPGTAAGAWFSSPFDGVPAGGYGGMTLSIATGFGGTVEVGALEFSLVVLAEDESNVAPESITTKHCYGGLYGRWGGPQGFVYLELLDPERLAVAYGIGACPRDLPENHEVYYR